MNLHSISIYKDTSGSIDINMTLGMGAYEYFRGQLKSHSITPASTDDDDIIPKSVQKRIAAAVAYGNLPIPEATMYQILKPYLSLKKRYCRFDGSIDLS